MSQQELNAGLMQFIQASPTPYHAVANLASELQAAGFSLLEEGQPWSLEKNGNYFVTRSGSLIAFRTGKGKLVEDGFHMVGAHTDSPCLKIKPQPEINRHQYGQLGVEVYGGALLNPWFDRDLSIAGRVDYEEPAGSLASTLVDFVKPVAIIPSLAIHLDKEANDSRAINAQTYLPLVFTQLEGEDTFDLKEILKEHLAGNHGVGDVGKVLSYDLRCYDVQAPALVGLQEEFMAAARLDNLLSCYIGMQGLLASDGKHGSLLVCSDHEEVGSVSAVGAKGPFLEAVLDRIMEGLDANGAEPKRRMLDNSMFFSVDNAHGIHPNFADKHDDKHGPILNQGPVIKVNSNQRYATTSETSAYFRRLCEKNDVPVQAFVVRNDMGCGSTIGPIVAGELGVKTLDIGVPTFAMHSIRELAGSRDTGYLASALTAFFNHD